MARAATTTRKITVTAAAWIVALIIFFPILWTILMSFKSEGDAINISTFFETPGLLDNVWGLMIILMLINLPIVIWMLYTYFKEIPVDILEAARMDGATLGKELVYVLVPMAVPGIASTMLLNVILAWNEAF